MAINSWFPKKCKSCRRKLKKDEPTHELRLNTADGILSLEICNSCADFYDKSAAILAKGRRLTDEEWEAEHDGDD